jgi:hypothetical protein
MKDFIKQNNSRQLMGNRCITSGLLLAFPCFDDFYLFVRHTMMSKLATKKHLEIDAFQNMAEREGFEPSMKL